MGVEDLTREERGMLLGYAWDYLRRRAHGKKPAEAEREIVGVGV